LVETACVDAGLAEVVLVEVVNEEGTKLDEDDDGLEEDDVLTDALTALHFPKAALQPAPQYMLVLPHHPYSLQQLPNDPEHVNP
jgi:hypothetical protein